MKNDLETIYEILKPRVNKQLLEGLFDAIFNNSKDKFFAFTFMDLERIDYSEYWGTINNKNGYSSFNIDPEKMKKYISPNTWQSKSIDECIKEGVYKSYSIRFTGILFNGEWYILDELCFFGEGVNESEVKRTLIGNSNNHDIWNSSVFQLHRHEILQNGDEIGDIELDEFANEPWMVAHIKQEKKFEINKAFTHYFNLEIFKPFIDKIKIKLPEEYESCISLFGEDFTLIFPNNKKYVILVMMVESKKKEYTIRYFLFHREQNKMYEWIYFKPEIHFSSFAYSLEVIEKLSSISIWNDTYFLNSSRTMDDENFWKNYVFKKENDKYIYLKEINP